MSASYSADGAPSIPDKIFNKGDDSKSAIDTHKRMREYGQSKGLSEFICGAAEPVILVCPKPEEVGGTVTSKALYDAKTKAADDQEKAIAAVMIAYRNMLSTDAWSLMLQKTRTGMFESLNPRQVYVKFKAAYCTMSGDKLHETQLALQKIYVLGTSLVDHIMAHASTREIYEMSGNATPQAVQVMSLKMSLNSLFVANYEAKIQIEKEHAAFIDAADSFAAYVQIMLIREGDGQFANQTNPYLHPSTKVNAVKEPHKHKDDRRPYEEKCAEAQRKFSSCSLDSDCPVHKVSDSGVGHKWKDCRLRTGQRRPDGK
jgi:hypothetical protein